MSETTSIFIDDFSEPDETGDEYRVWYVTPGDDDGEPTGTPIRCLTATSADRIAQKLADKLGVEVVTA